MNEFNLGYIKKEDALRAVTRNDSCQSIYRAIESIFLAFVSEQGEWIKLSPPEYTPHIYMCSRCSRELRDSDNESLLLIRYPFCHCGAEMKGIRT